MKKKIWIGTGIVTLLLLMISVSVYREVFAKGPVVKTVALKEDEISSLLMLPGTIGLEEEQIIYPSPEKGVLKEILVEEGQLIKKGTVIARFENSGLLLEIEQNKLAIESGNMRVSQLINRIAYLEEKEEIISGGLVEDPSLAQISAEIEQLEMELKLAELELKQANLQKNSITKKIAELEIKSAIDGTVLTVNENAAVSAAGADPAVHIGKMEGLTAKGLLSEYDTLKVSKGQKVSLTTDAVPDQKWPGEITRISTLPETQVGGGTQAVQYPVIIKLSGKNPVLKPGFQVIMEIEIDKKMTSIVPASAVFDEDDKQYVYVIEQGTAYRREVKTGIISGNKAEILEGLEQKEKIIAKPSNEIKDGMEVTVK